MIFRDILVWRPTTTSQADSLLERKSEGWGDWRIVRVQVKGGSVALGDGQQFVTQLDKQKGCFYRGPPQR